jgi:hypothetical protein
VEVESGQDVAGLRNFDVMSKELAPGEEKTEPVQAFEAGPVIFEYRQGDVRPEEKREETIKASLLDPAAASC